MKLTRPHFFALAALLPLLTAGCENHRNPPAVSTEAELLAAAARLDSAFLAAFNQGDITAFMPLYWHSPALTAYPPARVMQLKGYEAVKAFYTRDFASNKGARLEYLRNENVAFQDVVIGHGTFRWTMPMAGGKPLVLEARHTIVKAIKDGQMVIVVDHASAPLMAEAPAK